MSKIDHILRELEKNLEDIKSKKYEIEKKKEDPEIGKKIEVIEEKVRYFDKLENKITVVLGALKERLETIESKFSHIQELREGLFDVRRVVDEHKGGVEEMKVIKDIETEIEKRIDKPLKTLQILEKEIEVRIPDKFFSLEESVGSVKGEITQLREKIEEFELSNSAVILEKRLEFLEGEVDIILRRLGKKTDFEMLDIRIKELEKAINGNVRVNGNEIK